MNRFMNEGKLSVIPRRQKDKIELFLELKELFKKDIFYNETQINEILKPVFNDFVIIRRYLVDYNILKRSVDGKIYYKSCDVNIGDENE